MCIKWQPTILRPELERHHTRAPQVPDLNNTLIPRGERVEVQERDFLVLRPRANPAQKRHGNQRILRFLAAQLRLGLSTMMLRAALPQSEDFQTGKLLVVLPDLLNKELVQEISFPDFYNEGVGIADSVEGVVGMESVIGVFVTVPNCDVVGIEECNIGLSEAIIRRGLGAERNFSRSAQLC